MVAASLVIAAVAVGVKLCSKIIGLFREQVTVEQVGYIKGDGFTSFHAYSVASNQRWSKSKINVVPGYYLDHFGDLTPPSLRSHDEEIRAVLVDMSEFGAYGCSNQGYAVNYDKDAGGISMLMYNFAPVNDYQFTANVISLFANFTLEGDYAVMATTKKNAFHTNVEQSLEYYPPSITPKAVVDSIAMLLGPNIGGAVGGGLPDDWDEILESAAEEYASNYSDYHDLPI